MEDISFARLLEESFIKTNPDYQAAQQFDYEPAGIRFIQAYRGAGDPRKMDSWNTKPWILNGKKFRDDKSGKLITTRWDMTTDGSLLCFRFSPSMYYLLEVEALDEQQLAWAINPPLSDAEVIKQRLDLVIILGRILVSQNMPFDKLSSGELEMEHHVHLRLIQCATYKHPPHIPPLQRQ